ncbi:MAG TPA: hypothetical protein VFL79_03105 [Terriglobia bacterium]|nr:hypothetical protein [Terriglobia bacterium]
MFMSILVLVVSSALLFFYIQVSCETVLRREFSRAYFKDIIQAARLEYEQMCDAVNSKSAPDYAQMRLALKCDFFTLKYLLKNGGDSRRRLTRSERFLGLYFRFLLFSLPVRSALKLQERGAVLRMASILQFFANSIGERLTVTSFAVAEARSNS